MEKYQKELDKLFKEYNWDYWSPHEMLVRILEECGELARLVNHQFGPKKKKTTEAEQEMEEEAGDILYALICFANANNINLDSAIQKSINKARVRDKDRF